MNKTVDGENSFISYDYSERTTNKTKKLNLFTILESALGGTEVESIL